MKRLFDYYLYANFHIALCALSLVNVTCVLFHLPFSLPLILITFFGTLSLYCFQRLVGVLKHEREDFLGERNHWNFEHKNALIFLVLLSIAPITYSFLKLTIQSQLLLVIAGILSFVYSTPVFRIGKIRFRVRDFPLVKIFFIALVWVIITVLLPVFESYSWFMLAEIKNYYAVFFWCIIVFFLIIALTIPFDIRDIDFDPPSIRSIPMLIGEKRAISVAKFLLVMSCGIFYWGFEVTHEFQFMKIVFYFLWVAFAIWFLKDCSKKKSEYYFSFGVDGLIIILWLFLFYESHIKR